MRSIRMILVPVCRVILTVFVLSLVPGAVFAQDGPAEMQLKTGFFSPTKFTVGDSEPKPVLSFSGTSFKPEFEEAMSVHPAALEQAKKSLKWNGVALAGSLTLLAGSVWMLSDTLSDADDVSSGQLVEDETNWGPVYLVGAGAVTMLVGAIVGKSHLNKGVELYNEQAAAAYGSLLPSTETDAAGLRGSPRLGIGLRSIEELEVSRNERSLQIAASLEFGF